MVPAAAIPCRIANILPETTDPIKACSPAAALPAAIPKPVNPANVKLTTTTVIITPATATTFAVYLP
jgi:hypothetical protein